MINNAKLDRLEETNINGVWLQSDMNTKELTKKAYSQLSTYQNEVCFIYKECSGIVCCCVAGNPA
jgi:hypothetical protein